MGENACEHDADESRVRVASAEVGHAICSAGLLLWKRRGRRRESEAGGSGEEVAGAQLLFDFEPDR